MPKVHTTNAVTIDGREVIASTVWRNHEPQYVRMESAMKPDPSWAHIDPAGHEHRFAVRSPETVVLPTLNERTYYRSCETCDPADGCEGELVMEYTCLICGVPVDPRWIPDMEARTVGVEIPTPVLTFIDVETAFEPPEQALIRVVQGDADLIGTGHRTGLTDEVGSDRFRSWQVTYEAELLPVLT